MMHIGAKNPKYSYKLMGPKRTVTDEEINLWIMVNSSMRVSIQSIHCKKRKKDQQHVRDNKKKYLHTEDTIIGIFCKSVQLRIMRKYKQMTKYSTT